MMLIVIAAHKQKLLRPRVIERLGLSGQTDVVQHALRLFTEHVRTVDAIQPSLETAVYRIVLRWGNNTTIKQLLKVSVTSVFILRYLTRQLIYLIFIQRLLI